MMAVLDADDAAAPDGTVRRAAQSLAEGDADGALATLAPLVSDQGMALPARFLLGLVAWYVGRLDGAVGLLRQCHEEAPMNGAVAEVLASLHAQVGDLGESLFMGKMATALGNAEALAALVPPNFPSFDRAFLTIQDKPLLGRARLDLASGKLRDALEKARQHMALDPADGEGRLFYGGALLRAGSPSGALVALQPVEDDGDAPPAAASLYARALAGVGDAVEARRWHDRACAAAPEDARIHAARVADGLWLAEDATQLDAAAGEWVRRFAPPVKAPRWRQPDGKLAIAYLVSEFADPRDAAAIAAVARAHDRERVTVLGYGMGAQSWEENAPLAGAFDKWRDIGAIDPATLARFFAGDGVHVMVDAGGFAAPTHLLALARLDAALRVSWLGNPGGVARPLFDARITGESAMPHEDEAAIWRIAGGYPLARDWSRPVRRLPGSGPVFGADVRLCQIDAATARLWSAVLDAAPGAMLLLRANDMGPGASADRLIARFGREHAARIDIVPAAGTEDFYALADVALAPCRGASPRMAAEAVACGVPVVALAGQGLGDPYATLLRDLGLGPMLVAGDDREYAAIAARLACSAEACEQARAAVARSAAAGEASARRFARAIEDHATRQLAAGPA